MALNPDCLARLKLRRPPFEAVCGEEFIYNDPLLDGLIASGHWALDLPWRILLLTGGEGSGRSVQLIRLLGAVTDRSGLIAFRARPRTGIEAVEATIRTQLRASGIDDSGMTLSDLLVEQGADTGSPILAIDDAHLLDQETSVGLLRLRGEVRAAGGAGLRIILVGDPALEEKWRHGLETVETAEVARLQLRPFSRDQTAAYLLHRLRAAGCEDPEALLTAEEIANLHDESRGLPGALNLHATRWLERYCESARELAQAWAAKAALFAETARPAEAAAAPPAAPSARPAARERSVRPAPPLGRLEPESAVVLDRLLSDPREPPRAPPAAQPPAAGAPRRAPADVPIWNQRWFIPALAGGAVVALMLPILWQWSGRGSSQVPDDYWERPRTPPAALEPASAPHSAVPPPPVAATAPSAAPAPDTSAPPDAPGAPGESVVLELPEPPEAPETPEPASGPAPARPADAAIGALTARTEPTPPARAAAGRTPAAPPPPARAVPPPAPAAAAVPVADLAAGKTWLGRQNPNHLTIQLIAFSSTAAGERYAAEHGLTDVRYVPTRARDQDFVVLLSGNYPNQAQADRALRALPAAVLAERPWIRTIGSVKSVVRE